MRSTNFASPFLERGAEIARLEALLAQVRADGPQFVAINAEAGAGKSRLVEELRRRHADSTQFLVGRAFQATATTPYAVWVDALDMHLRALPRRELLHVLGEGADVRRLFPAAAQQLALPSEPVRAGEIGSEQTRLFGQMSALFTRLAASKPTVLVLDNLQWADGSSIELLHAVLRGTQGSPLLVLGLFRAEEVDADGALAICLDSLAGLGLALRMPLPPLGIVSTAAITQHATGAAWPDGAVHQLHLLTQGNALFTWECVKHALAVSGGKPFATAGSMASLPDSIESLIRERLRELDDDARRLLAIAAVIESPVTYRLLQAVTGYPEERLLDALDALTTLRFLNELVAGSAVLYEFHKPLVQAAVYRSMGAARRQFLHRVVADELMKQGDADAATVARHLVAGAAHGRRQEALPYLVRAAHEAVAVFGNHEAIALLKSAIELAQGADAAHPLGGLYLDLGESYKRLGQFRQAVETWSAALPLGDDRERATLRRCIARALWQQGLEHEAASQLEQGIAGIGDAAHSPEGAFLRQEYAQSKVRQGDLRGALEECALALAVADEERQPELAARLYVVLCTAHGYRGDMRSAQEAGRHALALSESLTYPGAAYLAHYTLAGLLRYEGQLDVFEQHCGACVDIAERMHAVALASWPLSLRTERYTLLGRLQEARAIGEQAVALDREIEQGTALPRSHAFLAVACRLLGDPAASRKHLAQAQRIVEDLRKTELRSVAVVQGAAAYLAFLDGRLEEALAGAEALLAHVNRHEPLPFYALHPHVLPLAAESAARLGRADHARKLLADIRQLQRGARLAEGNVVHVTGLLALLAGESEVARSELARAVACWEQAGRPYDRARARIDLADAHERLGAVDAAATELNAAGAEFETMGATRDAAAVGQRLRRMGVRPVFTSQRRTIGQPVSAREAEVIELVAQGKSNKEIAADLFLSELTIETHMKNILRKLGLKSRAHIASYAATQREAAAGGTAQLLTLPLPRRRDA